MNSGVSLKPVVMGGGQERGLRSGTENVAGVVGFAQAMEEARKHTVNERVRLNKLKLDLKKKIEEGVENIRFIGNEKRQLVNYLSIAVMGVDAERLVFLLEQSGVLVSTGAACSANKGTQSHVLKAIGLGDDDIRGSLRFTLGRLNDEQSIERAGKLIVDVIDKERKRVGYVG